MQSQSPQPQRGKQSSREYFIGIGIGFVPLILALVSIGGLSAGIGSALFSTGLVIAVLLYVGLFVASIICLCIERSRYVGYGLLTMVVAIPIVSFIGCLVSITGPHL